MLFRSDSLNHAGLICLAIANKPTISLGPAHYSLNSEGMNLGAVVDWIRSKSII